MAEHIVGITKSGALDVLYKNERTAEGTYLKFSRGELTAVEAAKSILDQVLTPFWYSIRLFSYDPDSDQLEAPLGQSELQTITFSDEVIRSSGEDDKNFLQQQRKKEIIAEFYKKEAADFGEFFFLIHARNESLFEREDCLHYVADQHYLRLYVIDWAKAEKWYRSKGARFISARYRKNAKPSIVPKNFISVSPLSEQPTQIIFIATLNKGGQVQGVASLRLFPDSMLKQDISEVDSYLLSVIDLIAPFIHTYSERISIAKQLIQRAYVLDKLSAVLNHDMNNYFPAATGVAGQYRSLNTIIENPTNALNNEERRTLTDVSQSLQTLADLTEVQRKRLDQIRDLARQLPDTSFGIVLSDTVGKTGGSLKTIVCQAVEKYGEKYALSQQSPWVVDIYSNLSNRYIEMPQIPETVIVMSQAQEVALPIILEEVLKNAIHSSGLERLEDNPIKIKYEMPKEKGGPHFLSLSNITDKEIDTAMLREQMIGGDRALQVSSGTGKGLKACDFLLKAMFGGKSKIEPEVIDIEGGVKEVTITLVLHNVISIPH